MTSGPGPEGGSPRAAETPRAPRATLVRRCDVTFADGSSRPALVVNLNALGAYVADDTQASVGDTVTCRLRLPGSESELEVRGYVAWANPRQPHPVHSLPPGYGVRFDPMPEPDRERIEAAVRRHLARRLR